MTAALLPPGTAASDKTGLADLYSLAGIYSNGPFFASLAYNDYDATSGTGDLDQLLRGVATYQFGDLQVGGLYEMGERDGSNSDTEAWGLSGKYSFGAVDLKGQYMDGTYENGVVFPSTRPIRKLLSGPWAWTTTSASAPRRTSCTPVPRMI